MAEIPKINDIASQLSTASRLVVSTDYFWVYATDKNLGDQYVKIPAELVRAYLTNGIAPVIGEDGTWWSNGQQLTDPTTGDPIVANQNKFLTKDEYDALEASGKLQSGVFYFIEEE